MKLTVVIAATSLLLRKVKNSTSELLAHAKALENGTGKIYATARDL